MRPTRSGNRRRRDLGERATEAVARRDDLAVGRRRQHLAVDQRAVGVELVHADAGRIEIGDHRSGPSSARCRGTRRSAALPAWVGRNVRITKLVDAADDRHRGVAVGREELPGRCRRAPWRPCRATAARSSRRCSRSGASTLGAAGDLGGGLDWPVSSAKLAGRRDPLDLGGRLVLDRGLRRVDGRRLDGVIVVGVALLFVLEHGNHSNLPTGVEFARVRGTFR